jgi:hypothetical protein
MFEWIIIFTGEITKHRAGSTEKFMSEWIIISTGEVTKHRPGSTEKLMSEWIICQQRGRLVGKSRTESYRYR